MARHSSWARFRGQNGSNAEVMQTEGRKLLGDLLNANRLGNIDVNARHKWLPDGTLLIAKHNGTVPTVVSISPPAAVEEDETTAPIWIPQGIVVTPATTAAPIGFGIPSIDGKLDPGTNTAGWTAGGACAQVLMTQAANAGYPDEQPPPPIFWDTWEAPSEDPTLPPLDQAWTAFRIRFRDLGSTYAAILAEVNGRRDPDQPLCPPFYGYEDMASEYGSLVAQFGTDSSAYPLGAATLFRRIEKDGTCSVTGSTTAVGELAIGTMPPGLTVSEIVDNLAAANPHIIDATYPEGTSLSIVGGNAFALALLNHRENWIRCGNIDWQSSHAEIPTLTWRGPQGRSIPPRELAFGRQRFDIAHLGEPYFVDGVEADFQGAPFRIFGREVFARGRVLGVLPNDGFVLGAACQRIEATLSTPLIYRLVVIAWHRADQFYQVGDGGLVALFDTTSDIRVWTADLPLRQGLALAPEYVVSDIYDETTNPRGWTDRGRRRLWPLTSTLHHGPGIYVDAGDDTGYPDEASRCSPKAYWQPWMFNPDGTEAVCLRSSSYVFPGNSIGGVMGPVQALKCAIAADGSPTLTIAWEMDEETAILFLPFESEPAYFAWDYNAAGDDRRASLSWTIDGGDNGSVIVSDTAGQSLVTYAIPGVSADDFDIGTAWYYDARTDDYVLAVQHCHSFIDYTRVAGVDVRVGVNSTDIETFAGSVPGGITVGFSGLGGTGATTDWCERDEFARSDYPHPRVMIAFARYGADYAAGVWYGVHPGDIVGDPTDDVFTGSYSNVAYVASYSTVDPAPTATDWFNFAARV